MHLLRTLSLLVAAVQGTSYCYYYESWNEITCYGPTETVTCSSVEPGWFEFPLPTGVYWVGPATTTHGAFGWLNLYPVTAITCYGPTETVTCSSVEPGWFEFPLPTGVYWVGPATTTHGAFGWLNLYPVTANGGIWDYHTKVPEFSCEGGFALHEGTYSKGCITVTDGTCWDRLYAQITRNSLSYKSMDECLTCIWGACRSGTTRNTVQRQVYDVIVQSV
eukprot:CAMPEP_0197075770 /NCGR_PEP_ID=MMETSP1384-20130603/211780_1 /TAXON_ID=29189 /ORGANISM="Ammonia sp." /LENGTH=219 /DNA_ID=CAMNT_0042514619 /DNA_START=81 /DNA_END=740 /DNA_ORIENTATION=-